MLEMVAPTHYRAMLREAPYEQDPDSKNPNISAAWIGMSKSGDITAPVIYAHSGNPADFALLRKTESMSRKDRARALFQIRTAIVDTRH